MESFSFSTCGPALEVEAKLVDGSRADSSAQADVSTFALRNTTSETDIDSQLSLG